eukprot:2252789-Amphidinium_carterae.3
MLPVKPSAVLSGAQGGVLYHSRKLPSTMSLSMMRVETKRQLQQGKVLQILFGGEGVKPPWHSVSVGSTHKRFNICHIVPLMLEWCCSRGYYSEPPKQFCASLLRYVAVLCRSICQCPTPPWDVA